VKISKMEEGRQKATKLLKKQQKINKSAKKKQQKGFDNKEQQKTEKATNLLLKNNRWHRWCKFACLPEVNNKFIFTWRSIQ
jgi:NAD(P)H-nitrite reductase large subunit